ncbi:hypothetical protein KEM52_003377 [Ascosphaera acerosa]|nr:hypothetical protein KEM52_003377 [Ascosphaera acerosa]
MPRVTKAADRGRCQSAGGSDTAAYALPSGDLRRARTQYKRWHDHKSKWALGTRLDHYTFNPITLANTNASVLAHAARQPRKGHLAMSAEPGFEKWVNRAATAQNRQFRHEVEKVMEEEENGGEEEEVEEIDDDDDGQCGDEIGAASGAEHPFPVASQTALAAALDMAVLKHQQQAAKRESKELRRSWEFVSWNEGCFEREGTDHAARDHSYDDFCIVELPGCSA